MRTAVGLLTAFATRTVLIRAFGTEYVGLGSLFSSLLQVLSLAELGLGTAITYSLYRPMAEGDDETVCAYLAFFRRAYCWIGVAMLVVGLAFVPVLPLLVRGDVPGGLSLTVCWFVYLANSSLSYLAWGWMSCVPVAAQRGDVLSRVEAGVAVVRCALQVALLVGGSFYGYLLAIPAATVAGNAVAALRVRRMWPGYACRGELDAGRRAELSRNVRGLLLKKAFAVTRNGLDAACISAFVGLAAAGAYSNYLVIHAALVSVFSILVQAMIPSIGNSVATEPPAKNLRDMRRFDFAYTAAAGWAATCLLCLWSPFVGLWAGEGSVLGWPVVATLTLWFYVAKSGDMWYAYSEALGLWWEMRWVSVAEAVANVALNVLLCRWLGVLGVAVASLVTLVLLNFVPCPAILFRSYFGGVGDVRTFFREHARWLASAVPGAVLCLGLCSIAPGEWLGLLVRAVICVVVYPVGWWLLWGRSRELADLLNWARATGLLPKYGGR